MELKKQQNGFSQTGQKNVSGVMDRTQLSWNFSNANLSHLKISQRGFRLHKSREWRLQVVWNSKKIDKKHLVVRIAICLHRSKQSTARLMGLELKVGMTFSFDCFTVIDERSSTHFLASWNCLWEKRAASTAFVSLLRDSSAKLN